MPDLDPAERDQLVAELVASRDAFRATQAAHEESRLRATAAAKAAIRARFEPGEVIPLSPFSGRHLRTLRAEVDAEPHDTA